MFFILCSFSFAQQDSLAIKDDSYYKKQDISKEALQDYKSDKAFNYEIKPEDNDSWWAKFKRWFYNGLKKIVEAIFGMESAGGVLWFILRVLPYILLAGLVFLLIRFFLKVNSKQLIYGETKKGSVAFTDEEQIIRNEDISTLISEALKQNNYRLAIRYYYLLSLKELTEANIIDWQPQKTNEDYKREIVINTIQTQFEKITRIYDYVWYGEFEVDAPKFEKLKFEFITLNKQIN